MLLSYLRVSHQTQVQGDGLERQRESIKAWVKAKTGRQWVDREFVEAGFTGTAFDRPTMGQLFSYLQGEGIEDATVLVERSDRLARDNLAAELILQEFRALGVKVIDCEADLDLTTDGDPSKVLIRQILQAVAEFDKSSLVKKLRRARDRKRARDGRCEGIKPYGDLPGEADTLGHIKSLCGAGHSLRSIAGRLNEMGLKTRFGRPWGAGTLSRIVKRLDP